MSSTEYQPRDGLRVGGVVAVAIVMIATALWKIKTSLGVKALTIIGETDNGDPIYDKVGHEAIWRIWWRARDEFISVSPQWLLTAALIGLLAMFCFGLLAAVWFALSPESSPEPVAE